MRGTRHLLASLLVAAASFGLTAYAAADEDQPTTAVDPQPEAHAAAPAQAAPKPAASPSPAPRHFRIRSRPPFSIGPSFDAELIHDLPLGEGVWTLLEAVEPTAIVDRIENGGLYTGEVGLIGIRGTSWTQASWRLEDFDLTDPDRTGTPLFIVDPGALESVDVAAGLMPADSDGSGPAVTLHLRRPEQVWHGAVDVDFVPIGLQQGYRRTGGAPAIAHYASFGSGHFRLAGPLQENLGLFVSGTYAQSARLERAYPTRLSGQHAGILSQLFWQTHSGDEVRLLGGVQQAEYPYPSRFRLTDGVSREADHFYHLQSTWQRRGPKALSISGGYVGGSFDPHPQGETAVVESTEVQPIPSLFAGQSRRGRVSLSARMNALTDARRVVSVGGSFARVWSTTKPAESRALTPETVYGIASRVWDYGWAGPESSRSAAEANFWITSQARYGRLSLDSGLRLEWSSGKARDAANGIDWLTLAPRIMARFLPMKGDDLVLLAGWARYRDRLPLSLLAYGDPAGLQGDVYRWVDRNLDGQFQQGERRALISHVGPGGPYASIDPGLRPPHANEVFVGIETRIGSSWRSRTLAYYRRELDFLGSLNVGVPLSSYDVTYVPDPGDDIAGTADDQQLPIYNRRPDSFGNDRYVLTNDPTKGFDKGLEFYITGNTGKNLRLLFGATASKSFVPAGYRGFTALENDSGLVGDRLENPNSATFSRGRPFFERGYTLKVAGTYRFPYDIHLGATSRYQDGQHFARLVIAPNLNQGAEAIRAFYNGDSRFTFVLTFDARLEKGFKIGRGRIAAVAEVFNLGGSAIEVEEEVVWAPNYRATSAVQPPRAFRFGVRWDF